MAWLMQAVGLGGNHFVSSRIPIGCPLPDITDHVDCRSMSHLRCPWRVHRAPPRLPSPDRPGTGHGRYSLGFTKSECRSIGRQSDCTVASQGAEMNFVAVSPKCHAVINCCCNQ